MQVKTTDKARTEAMRPNYKRAELNLQNWALFFFFFSPVLVFAAYVTLRFCRLELREATRCKMRTAQYEEMPTPQTIATAPGLRAARFRARQPAQDKKKRSTETKKKL